MAKTVNSVFDGSVAIPVDASIQSVNVLDKGLVQLDPEWCGSDAGVVRRARISNGAALEAWRGAPDERLIRFLAENRHFSPFEHNCFSFYVKAPLFVVREWQRHRTFSYNERSGRYKEFEEDYYIPETWREPHPKNKQSSVPSNADIPYREGLYLTSVRHSFRAYKALLNAGVAREMARMALPVSMYTEMFATGNLRKWMHFLDLRLDADAQFEIRAYAEAIASILKDKMPLSFAALRGLS